MNPAPEAGWFLDRLGGFGDRPALLHGGVVTTFAELRSAIDAEAEFLGTIPRGVVLVGSDYAARSVSLLLAALLTGHIVAPVTARREDELRRLAVASGASTFLRCDAGAREVVPLAPGTEVPPLVTDLLGRGRAGLVLFSSGSTGQPKAMLHDFARFLEAYTDRKPRELRVLLFLLFDHIGGMNTLFGSLAAGMTLVVPDSRDPEAVGGLIESHRVGLLPGTPTFLNLLLMARVPERFDCASLRVITYGAEAMPESLLARVRKAFPRARLIQTFGTSETGIARMMPSSDTGIRLDPASHEHRVVGGELWLRSRTQVLGYLNAPGDRFTEDGWFRTGDLVEERPDGSLRFLGRSGEVINVGGEKVSPAEVESVLLELPEVSRCRAYGRPHPVTGQVVGVELVGDGNLAPPELRSLVRRHARARLARFKAPVEIRVVDELPVSGRFKTVRQQP